MSLVTLSSRWITAPELERRASELLRVDLRVSGPALVQPYQTWVMEDYYIIHLCEALG